MECDWLRGKPFVQISRRQDDTQTFPECLCVCVCVCVFVFTGGDIGRWPTTMYTQLFHVNEIQTFLSYILHSSLFLPVFAIYFTGINSWGIGFPNFAASIIFADIMIAELFCKKYYELIFWLFLMISSFKIIWREIKSSEMYKSMGLFLSILWFLFYKNLT